MKERRGESVGTLVSMFAPLTGLADRVQQVRLQARAVRRAIDDLDRVTTQALHQLGLERKDHADDVVDVGRRSFGALAKRALGGALALLGLATLGAALLSFGIFGGVAVAAFLIVSRVLGVRVDVARR